MKILRFMMVICMSLLLVGCFQRIHVLKDADAYFSQNYESVQQEFLAQGFESVILKDLANLEGDEAEMDGLVQRVFINDKDDFKANDSYSPKASVVIEYHSMKKLKLPLSLQEIKGLEADNVVNHFENIGFCSVNIEEVFDLEIDDSMESFQNEVKINGQLVEVDGASYPCNAEVVIVVHRPKQDYQVNLHIQFPSNLFFNKYDVEMYLNEDKFDLLHGEDKDYTLHLGEGTYSLVFKKVEQERIYGSYQFDVKDHMDVSLEIQCDSFNIDVMEKNMQLLEEWNEDSILIDFNEEELEHLYYEDVVTMLQEKGFTNIKLSPAYDLMWGWGQEGKVASVLIQGLSNVQKGQIVPKDCNIYVIYHMKIQSQEQSEEQIHL